MERYSRLDSETQSYFREVDAHFKTLVEDGSSSEEQEILIGNVFEEIQGREVDIVTDAECSRIVEALIGHASQGPFGSHVLETLLDTIVRRMYYDRWELDDVLEDFTEVASAHLFDMISSKYGSFVGRRLVGVLCGELRDPSSSQKNRKNAQSDNRSYAHGARMNLAKKVDGGQGSGPSVAPRVDLLDKVCKQFVSDEVTVKDIHDLQTSPFAGPFLKALLEGVGRVGMSSCDQMLLMTDRSGSHIVEAALLAAPDGLFSKLCTNGFKGRLPALAQHPSANFTVQAAIAHVKKSQQLKRMFEDLKDCFGGLLLGRRGGVVTVLLAAAARLNCLQSECSKTLWDALNTSFKDAKTPLHSLITLDTTVELGGQTGRLSPLGCAALVSLFQYPKGMAVEWNKALENLSKKEVAQIALDAGGCRVLEAYLQHEDTGARRAHDLIRKIDGAWADVASFGSGNKFVDTCFGIAGAAEKKQIALELAQAEERIAGTHRGPALLQRCRVDDVKKDEKGWEHRFESVEATKKEFEDLFGSNDSKDTQQALLSSDKQDKKKKKKKKTQDEKDKETKKKEKKKKKRDEHEDNSSSKKKSKKKSKKE
eukprot:jgi/Picre1/35065/NNA_002530.t1